MTRDPLTDTPWWGQAVLAGAKANPSCTSCGAPPTTKRCPMCRGLVEEALEAALPLIREGLAEELDKAAPEAVGSGPDDQRRYGWLDAAAYLTREPR